MSGADPGDFGQGLAFGTGDTIWGKTTGGLIRHAQFDINSQSGVVIHSFAGYPNLAPLGIDPVNKLCAGISIETPDNLRLIDISNLGGGLFTLDTELFPTDNPNPGNSGSVTFGGNNVYAMDSDNGLIAMSLNLACVPTKLSATRSAANLVLSWGRGDYRLQGATTLGNWNNMSATSPATNSAASGIHFFRLVCP